MRVVGGVVDVVIIPTPGIAAQLGLPVLLLVAAVVNYIVILAPGDILLMVAVAPIFWEAVCDQKIVDKDVPDSPFWWCECSGERPIADNRHRSNGNNGRACNMVW